MKDLYFYLNDTSQNQSIFSWVFTSVYTIQQKFIAWYDSIYSETCQNRTPMGLENVWLAQ